MATNVKINFITGSAAKVNLTSSNVIKATIKDRGPVGPIGLGITEQNIGFTLTGGITPKTLTVALDANVSGTNTGDSSGHSGLATIDNPTFTTGVTTPAIKITTGAAANKVLTSDADGDATWESPATSLSVTTKGDLQTFSTVADRLPIGVDGKVLKANASTATGLEWGDAGTSSPLTTKGDLYGFDTVNQRIPIGTDGQVLTADSTDDQGVAWKAIGAESKVIAEVPTGDVDGTNNDFTLSEEPFSGTLQVYLNGVRQKITDDYTLSTATISFVTAPTTDSKILCDYNLNVAASGNADTLDGKHGAEYMTLTGTETGTNKTFTSPKINEDVALTATATQLNNVASGGLSKILSANRNLEAVSGDISYTGIGFKPTSVMCISSASGGNFSVGIGDTAKDSCLLEKDFDANNYISSSQLIFIQLSSGNRQEAIIKSYDNDGITLTWTKVGTPTGTINFKILCFR